MRGGAVSGGKYLAATALLSACGAYRYRLNRCWGYGRPLLFVMLNPSTADGSEDDATIRKCVGFARRLGFTGIQVVNLFAYRATDPVELVRAGYPVGPDNDAHIADAVSDAGRNLVVCAWGGSAPSLAKDSRVADVMTLLRRRCAKPVALALTNGGVPRHPLMLPYSCSFRLRSLP